jgi:hypothetical protein
MGGHKWVFEEDISFPGSNDQKHKFICSNCGDITVSQVAKPHIVKDPAPNKMGDVQIDFSEQLGQEAEIGGMDCDEFKTFWEIQKKGLKEFAILAPSAQGGKLAEGGIRIQAKTIKGAIKKATGAVGLKEDKTGIWGPFRRFCGDSIADPSGIVEVWVLELK